MTKYRIFAFILIIALFVQGCFSQQTMNGGPQTVEEQISATRPSSTITSMPLPTGTPAPAYVQPSATPQPPAVTITVIRGQIYVRRGPGLPYNQIGILKEGSSAIIIGQDVLSRWVQIKLPGSEQAGWVSIMTNFTRVDGDLASVPNFTFTEWPLPAYIKNCTEHDLMIEPDGLYVYNLFTNPRGWNEVQVNPGVYTLVDLFVEGEPEIQKVNVREGVTVYITVNGLGENHNCP